MSEQRTKISAKEEKKSLLKTLESTQKLIELKPRKKLFGIF